MFENNFVMEVTKYNVHLILLIICITTMTSIDFSSYSIINLFSIQTK